MIRNILFDWSGTLVDDLPAVWRASNHAFAQAGVPALSLDEFRASFCLPYRHFYDRFTPHVPLPQLEDWFHAHFQEVQHLVIELPRARDFLTFCQNHHLRLFLLSTVRQEHFNEQAARTGFGAFFEQVYAGIMDKRRKILEILQDHSLLPEETVFVGDMQHDIDTARHGGVVACAVLTGYNRLDQLRASEPDLIVEHLAELQDILETNRFQLPHRARGLEIQSPTHPIATVGALIVNPSGQVLMVRTQKWSDLWGIPGGKIKYGEPSADALRRELLEETGLAVDEPEFIMTQDCIHSREFYRDAHFLLMNYVCHCGSDAQVKLNDEAREFRWVHPREALDQLPLNQPTRCLLEEVLRRQQVISPLDAICLHDLECFCRVGVPEAERAQPQRLLITLEMRHDCRAAAASDDLGQTLDYYAVSRRVLALGQSRSWKLIETLASDLAALILSEFQPAQVTVEIKKFIIPEASHVAVRLTRHRTGSAAGTGSTPTLP